MNRAEPIYWLGEVKNCDICGTDLSVLPSFADCVINRRTWMWGLACTYCIEANELQIKPGCGQLYTRQLNRAYLCERGQPPPALFSHKQ